MLFQHSINDAVAANVLDMVCSYSLFTVLYIVFFLSFVHICTELVRINFINMIRWGNPGQQYGEMHTLAIF